MAVRATCSAAGRCSTSRQRPVDWCSTSTQGLRFYCKTTLQNSCWSSERHKPLIPQRRRLKRRLLRRRRPHRARIDRHRFARSATRCKLDFRSNEIDLCDGIQPAALKTAARLTEFLAVLRQRHAFAAFLQETWRVDKEAFEEDGWLFLGISPSQQLAGPRFTWRWHGSFACCDCSLETLGIGRLVRRRRRSGDGYTHGCRPHPPVVLGVCLVGGWVIERF